MRLVVPDGLKLRPFQERLVKAQLENQSPYIYDASDPGLGKTIMTAAYTNSLGAKSLLSFVPAALQLNTIKEFNKWLMPDIEYAVVPYSLLVARPSLFEEIMSRKWDLINCDEFHYCKNLSAQRTRKVFKTFKKSRFGLRLSSGSPVTRCATDLYPILNYVAPRLPGVSRKTLKLCSDMDAFGKEFAYRSGAHRGSKTSHKYHGIKKRTSLKLVDMVYRELGLLYRTTQEEALPELPEMTHKIVPISLDIKDNLNAEALAEFRQIMRQREDPSRKEPPSYSRMRKLLGSAKANSKDIYEYIRTFLDAGWPVVIMAGHTDAIRMVGEHMKEYNPVFYTGHESKAQKQAAVDAFQEGRTDVFIGNILAASVGITLTRAKDVFILETPWLSEDYKQASRRVQRIGQKNACTTHMFKSKNKLDGELIDRLFTREAQIARIV